MSEPTLVVFRLGDAEFGAPVEGIREVVDLGDVTRVPRADADVVGLVNLRGQVVTVVDVRRRLGVAAARGPSPQVLVLDAPGTRMGALVDAVVDVRRVQEAAEGVARVDLAALVGPG